MIVIKLKEDTDIADEIAEEVDLRNEVYVL